MNKELCIEVGKWSNSLFVSFVAIQVWYGFGISIWY